jgi:hypothetical protein
MELGLSCLQNHHAVAEGALTLECSEEAVSGGFEALSGVMASNGALNVGEKSLD